MADDCEIEWVRAVAKKYGMASRSWNPVIGCSRASDGCANCYAAGMAYRLGVTAENQEQAVKSINALTGNITVNDPVFGGGGGIVGIDWVICGGESGPNARPMHPSWPQALRDQCQAADVPFFFKGGGEWTPIRPARSDDLFDAHKELIVLPGGGTTSGLSRYGNDAFFMRRVGKRAAGRHLEGRTWDEVP